MSINVVKYIFWILICLPVLVFGSYLFIKLHKDYFVIKRINDRKKKAEQAEMERYKQFDVQYRKEHPGEY